MRIFSFIVLAVFMIGCQSNNQQKSTEAGKDGSTVYQAPVAPNHLTTQEAQQEYVFTHYWDKFNFLDTSLVLKPEYGEQAIVDYMSYFPKVNKDLINQGLEDVFNQAKTEKKTFNYFQETMARYLGDPNSPLRNDEIYEQFIVTVLKTDHLEEAQKIKYETMLPLIRRNKVGTKASDFKFLKQQGQTTSLLAEQADLTFLMFYEPGCSSCERAFEVLRQAEEFNQLINTGKLKVLAIYPDGNKEIWENYQKMIPENWINGIDEDQYVVTKGIYQIKATPTIYLLDKNKNVLLKDASLEEVGAYLDHLSKT